MTRIAVILLIAEFCPKEKRYIISVFKLIQDLLAPSKVKGRNQFRLLMAKLPDTHKAKWFAGAALNTAEQSMQSVLSTALSRLNSFLDSELEQILCFDTVIDAECFVSRRPRFLSIPFLSFPMIKLNSKHRKRVPFSENTLYFAC